MKAKTQLIRKMQFIKKCIYCYQTAKKVISKDNTTHFKNIKGIT